MTYHNADWDSPASGDCCAAAIFEIINLAKIILGYSGGEIPDDNVIAWAKQVGTWNGGNIPDVMIAATTVPIIDAAGQKCFLGGTPLAVNYEDMNAVYSALQDHYALDLGVDSRLYAQAINGPGQVGVAPLLNFPLQNYDHSIPAVADWGTAGFLAQKYADATGQNVQLGNLPADTPCVGTITWGSRVITPVKSFQMSTGEAWAVPSYPTPVAGPTPVPVPVPDPNNPPVIPPRRRPTLRGIEMSNALALWHEKDPVAVEKLLDEIESHVTVQQAMAHMEARSIRR